MVLRSVQKVRESIDRMRLWHPIGTGVMVFVIGCGSASEPAPPPIVARSTETLPVEPPAKTPAPESAHPSNASLFADEPEPRGRKRRKRRRKRQRVTTSLVGSSAGAKSEENVALRHRVSTGARDSGVAEGTLKVINNNSQAISHCVADASRRGERATGKMEVEVVVDADGGVRSTRLLSEDYVGSILGSCVLRRIKEWRFDASGRSVTLVLPFVVEAAH